MLKVTLIALLVIGKLSCDDDVETTTESGRFCRERVRPVGTNKSDLYNVVEAAVGDKIILQCHFCNENDDGHPKNWFKLDALNDNVQEVQLGMENNMSFNRIHINMEHSLIITNISTEDAGEYFCKGLSGEEDENKYNFFVDVKMVSTLEPEKGNIFMWMKYHAEQFEPINILLHTSRGYEHDFLKQHLMISLEVVTEWDTPGPCEICGRPKGDGRRNKKGHCRLKVTQITNETVTTKNPDEKLVLRATHLSCRSMALMHLIPGIVNMTSGVPDFLLVEPCSGTCNPDAEGVYKGWKSTKKKGYKYRKTFVLAENAHLTLVCPESTLENQVVWKKNGKLVKPGQSIVVSSAPEIEPRVTVDTFNTLYLYGVTKEEEGNYTCQVDEIRMQLVRVFVVSKAKLLTQAFVRHMMYLSFVLSLTLSCYCAGLVVTWTRRKKFKTYTDVRDELRKANKLDDEDEDVETSDITDEFETISPSVNSPLVTKTPKHVQTDEETETTGDTTSSRDPEIGKSKTRRKRKRFMFKRFKNKK